MGKGIGGHQSAKMITDQWLTPPEIIKSLGSFDLDPCSPLIRPWDTAKVHYSTIDNGLIKNWFGRVWLNPPYGQECIKWISKLSSHGNGIALIFARTETKMFFNHIWNSADSIFFFKNRLHFYTVEGVKYKMNAGAPSCLISYGELNTQALEESGLDGKHVFLSSVPMVIIGISPSWKSVITIAINRLNGEGALSAIYEMVEAIAPDKIQKNPFYKEKIRQKLQLYFKRTGPGFYSKADLAICND